MSDFEQMLNRFGEHEQNLKQLGDALVLRYPQSKNLIQLSQELGAAIDGLGALKERLGTAIHDAESQTALATDISTQMNGSDIYQSLADRDRQKLIEYLLQNQAGLASPEELKAYVQRSLEQKSDSDLLGEFSKVHILELGKAILPDADEFDSYKAGTDALLQELADPEKKKEIIADLADVLMEETPATIVKLFYSDAFKQADNGLMPPASSGPPAPPIGGDAEAEAQPEELEESESADGKEPEETDAGPAPMVEEDVPAEEGPEGAPV